MPWGTLGGWGHLWGGDGALGARAGWARGVVGRGSRVQTLIAMGTEKFSKYKAGEGFLGQQEGRSKPLSTENMRKGNMYVRGCFALLFLILLL